MYVIVIHNTIINERQMLKYIRRINYNEGET
jgi:hypothetical protein